MSKYCYCVEQHGTATHYGDYCGDWEYISEDTTYTEALKIYEECIEQMYNRDIDDAEFHGYLYLLQKSNCNIKVIKKEYYY